MDKKHVDDKRTTCSSTTLNKVKQTILDSVTNNTKDFYISYKAKNALYDNDTAETKPADIKIWSEDKMKDLLNKSIKDMGFSDYEKLSNSQRQALFFTFPSLN